MYFPEEAKNVLAKAFNYPSQPLFGVVATLREAELNVRMMRIFDFDENGSPILFTHTQSAKWKEFSQNPFVSICIVSDNKLTQVIIRGNLKLETKDTAAEMASTYWEWMRPDVKKIYNPFYAVESSYCSNSTLTPPSQVPTTFGILLVIPTFWEVLELAEEYIESQRHQYSLVDTVWQKKRINVA